MEEKVKARFCKTKEEADEFVQMLEDAAKTLKVDFINIAVCEVQDGYLVRYDNPSYFFENRIF